MEPPDEPGLFERLCQRFEHFELRRDAYRVGKSISCVWFFAANVRDDDDSGVPRRTETPLIATSGPDPKELAHEALGDRERLKLCASCRSPLPPTKYAKHAGTADGLSRDCRDCEAERLRKYRRRKADIAVRPRQLEMDLPEPEEG